MIAFICSRCCTQHEAPTFGIPENWIEVTEEVRGVKKRHFCSRECMRKYYEVTIDTAPHTESEDLSLAKSVAKSLR